MENLSLIYKNFRDEKIRGNFHLQCFIFSKQHCSAFDYQAPSPSFPNTITSSLWSQSLTLTGRRHSSSFVSVNAHCLSVPLNLSPLDASGHSPPSSPSTAQPLSLLSPSASPLTLHLSLAVGKHLFSFAFSLCFSYFQFRSNFKYLQIFYLI